ncbi:hypothetical protein K431DRAFT_153076 [Polychaeton citri CBS 116435]|uniref:Nephrocystin 3-like N-terminal domain-containing protein n=1 Tax=Polychaeton citri CBS 116435 TaxID=1314669 RepID=A0A9P4PYW5_9PEZI|nr:hypothetical protein K431DRAFT_153076 [Polychaeton citri CBS 116435]
MSLTVPLSRLGEWTDASDNSTTGLVSIEQGVQTLGLNSQDNQREEILGWLSRVDIRPAHFAARVQQRQVSNKHSLFFRSDTYQAWLGDKGHILWLRGSRPATNYVVSVAIDEAEKLSWQKPTEGLGFAYYYFAHPIIEDFSPETVLRVLLAQLSEKAQSLPREIEALYNRSQDRDPTIDELLHTLQKTFLRNKHVYLAFDAIDTTPERAATFVHLLTRISCLSTNLSVIVSTKEENHVLESLLQCTTSMIVLEEFRVEHNLHACFQKRLHHDERYRGLSAQRKAEMHKIILTEDSGAFFASDRRLQLVATQLDIMAPFLTTPCFSTQLQNLPRTLNTAYDRILIGVDAPMFQMFYTILQWLAFSLRPLSIEEVIQVMSISCDSPQQDLLSIYNSRVLPILSSLAMFTSDNKLVRLHTCFKEYLTSKYIRESPCSRYRITESGSHCAIAHDCLRYLLKFHESSALPRKELLAQFPLLEYSARFWYRHSRTLTRLSSGSALDAKIHNLEMQLFRAQNEATLLNWLKISRPDSAMNDPEKEDLSAHLFSHTSELFGSPMYYAASCGLTSVVSNLIQQGHSAKTQAEHVDGCMYPGPLEAAVENGFSDIAELLLEADARPNIWTQEGGTCLLRACRKGDGWINSIALCCKCGCRRSYSLALRTWCQD